MNSSAGLEDLYREIVLDHYRRPRNRGELPVPPATKVTGFNPLCGDEVVVYLKEEDGSLDIRIQGRGCSISQSSASLMSEAVKGKSVEEALSLVDRFKAMMSIHRSGLEPDDEGEPDQEPPQAAKGSGPRNIFEQDFEDLGELSALRGVVKFPVRIKCATLPWNTLVQAIQEMRSEDKEHP
jgi:nitrogen fixation NifU-like protein